MDVNPDRDDEPMQDAHEDWIFNDPLAKNPYRLTAGEPDVMEILLNHNRVTKIDAHRHAEIKGKRWTAHTPKAETSYVGSGWDEGHAQLLHVLLFPNIIPPRDHINRDPLDNRAVNIRSGANGINQRNQPLSAGGVRKDIKGKCFVACWVAIDGSGRSKSFRWKDYENEEACRLAAVAFRKQMADGVVERISAMQKEAGGKAEIARVGRRPRNNRVGAKNLNYINGRDGERAGIVAAITINGVLYNRYWAFALHNNDVDRIIEEAKRWLEQTKLDHPRQPRKPYAKRQKRIAEDE